MKTVDLKIMEFHLRDSQLLKGVKAFAYFKIKNEGNTSATGCVCSVRDEKDSLLTETREFSIEAEKSIEDSLKLPDMQAQWNKKLSLIVKCEEASRSDPERNINIDVIGCAKKLKIGSFKYTGVTLLRKFRAEMILSNPCEINLKKTMIRCIVYKWNDTSSKVDVITTAPSPLGGGQSVKMLIVGKKVRARYLRVSNNSFG